MQGLVREAPHEDDMNFELRDIEFELSDDSNSDLSLDALGILMGTNKSSLYADYLRHYDELFRRYRDKEINFIEIGVAQGRSARTWERYLPKARLIGVDINENTKRSEGGRVTIEIGSQADAGFLAAIAEKYPPTIVVDDGSHQADHMAFTFKHLFPAVLPGGCYVIEDLYIHFGTNAKDLLGNAKTSPPDYLRRIMTEVVGRRAFRPSRRNSLLDQIDRFCVIPGAAFIWKKESIENIKQTIADTKRLIESSGVDHNWRLLADFIISNDGPIEEAEYAARRAIAHHGAVNSYVTLADVLERKGDQIGAISALESAMKVAKGPGPGDMLRARLERLSSKPG